MEEDYLMRPGDVFVARECGCSISVISGPPDITSATQAPRCCCGHLMAKVSPSAVHGAEDIEEVKRPALVGMLD